MTYPIHYDVQYPERLARWKLVFWKLLSAVPHVFILAALTLSLVVVIPIGWVGILIRGRFPEPLHRYASGVLRWGARVQAYVLSLTDDFPPFSLSADPSPAGRNVALKSAIAAAVVIAAIGGACAAFVTFAGQEITRDVSYQRLLVGNSTTEERTATVQSGVIQLTRATDPADENFAPLLSPEAGGRFVELELVIKNERAPGEIIPISSSHFSLKDSSQATHDAVLALVDGRLAPFDIPSGETATVRLAFELSASADPSQLRYDVLNYIDVPRVGETIVYNFR